MTLTATAERQVTLHGLQMRTILQSLTIRRDCRIGGGDGSKKRKDYDNSSDDNMASAPDERA